MVSHYLEKSIEVTIEQANLSDGFLCKALLKEVEGHLEALCPMVMFKSWSGEVSISDPLCDFLANYNGCTGHHGSYMLV